MKAIVAHISLIAIMLSELALAGSYYVASSGSDTNSGTSSNSPWKTLSMVYDRSLTSPYLPGDSVLLNAGDSFDGPLLINQSGTNGAPITIDRYGTGANPIIYGDHPSAVWEAVPGREGLFVSNLGNVNVPVGVSQVYQADGLKYWHLLQGTNTLEDYLNTFTNATWGSASSNVYVMTPSGNPPPQMRLFVTKTVITSGSYHIIQNLEVANGGAGISVDGISNVVRNNLIHDGTGSGIIAYNGVGTQIVSNTVVNNGYTMIYLVNGGNNWVHHNTCSSNGLVILGNINLTAGRDTSGVGLLAGTNNLIEHNFISHMMQGVFDYYYEVGTTVRYNYGLHAAVGASPSGTGLKLHNNVFNIDGSGNGITAAHTTSSESPLPDQGPNLIYNNIVYNHSGYALFTLSAYSTNVVVRNNIFYTTKTNAAMAQVTSGIDIDHNMYYCPGSAVFTWNLATKTFATFQSSSGQESNGLYGLQPLFMSTNYSSAVDFSQSAESPSVNAGQNLKDAGIIASDAEYVDYSGISIPQGAGADIGAFEFLNTYAPKRLNSRSGRARIINVSN